jgi:uncharacterized LabA/DUF88 family protein
MLVDAGFLLNALVLQVGAGGRSQVNFDYAALSDVMADLVEEDTGVRPIRRVWYDAAQGGRPTADHRALASIPGVQVMLGWTIKLSDGTVRQKAVDSLLVRDMLRIAYRNTSEVVVLVAGDGDLVPGAQEAADYGLAIHLWGIASADLRLRQSTELIAIADRRLSLDLGDLVPFVKLKLASTADRNELSDRTVAAAATSSMNITSDASPPASPELADAVSAAEGEESAELHSALSAPTEVQAGAPSLRQLSTPEEFADDLLTDQIDDAPAIEVGHRYAQRWLARSDAEVLARFRAKYKRPTLPLRLDKDVLAYLKARGIDQAEQDERRAARNGFWDAVEVDARESHTAPRRT